MLQDKGNISKKLYQASHRVGTNKNDIAGKAKFSILKRKGADTEKHGVGTFWAFLDFTLPDSLDMIKIETVFTGYRGRAYVQKKASQRNK